MIRPLNTSVSAVFSAAGIARARIGPTVYGENWRIRRMTVSTTSTVDTDVRVYLNSEIDTQLVAGSFSGNQDFNETDLTLQTLDNLIIVWVGGSIGANASFLLQGTVEDSR
jgi:hypothetical protein